MKAAIPLTVLCMTIALTSCHTNRKTDILQKAEQSSAPTAVTEIEMDVAEQKPQFTLEGAKCMEAGEILTKEQLGQLELDQLFYSKKISDKVFARMEGVSFGEGCIVQRCDLRYLRVLHWGFDGETHIGELVCSKALAADFLEIFQTLYQEGYQIEKMFLVDNYNGDDEASMADNNTSCFNFRIVKGTDHLSKHAYGRAIDINPLYNPYITSRGVEPANAAPYADRSADFPYKIDTEDLCYRLFVQHGFTWGGSWNTSKDYQHFQKAE